MTTIRSPRWAIDKLLEFCRLTGALPPEQDRRLLGEATPGKR